MPPGDLKYYKAQYVHQWFWPVYGDFVLDAARRLRLW